MLDLAPPTRPERRFFAHAAATLALAALVLATTWAYVRAEHTFYTSDYGGYQTIAEGLLVSYGESLRTAAGAVIGSMQSEYNALFAIPLVPFLLVFGDSRIVYELALAIVYFVPFTAAIAAISVRLLPRRAPLVFWLTVGVVLLTPMAWVPMLRGYPDVGAALLIALAVLACLRDPALSQPWQPFAIGIPAALSMLVRRHFAYDAVAVFAALALHAMLRLARARRAGSHRAFRDFTMTALRVAASVVISLLVLLVVDRAFVSRSLSNNYLSLYTAYMSPPWTMLRCTRRPTAGSRWPPPPQDGCSGSGAARSSATPPRSWPCAAAYRGSNGCSSSGRLANGTRFTSRRSSCSG